MTGNMFVDILYESRKSKSIFHYIKFWFFLYKLSKVVPNFNMLWQIADFLKTIEIVYLYPNNKHSKHSPMYSIKGKAGENGFGLNVYEFEVAFRLAEEDKFIEITVSHNNKVKSYVAFKDGEAIVETDHDEQMFININDLIMDNLTSLLKQYYKRG